VPVARSGDDLGLKAGNIQQVAVMLKGEGTRSVTSPPRWRDGQVIAIHVAQRDALHAAHPESGVEIHHPIPATSDDAGFDFRSRLAAAAARLPGNSRRLLHQSHDSGTRPAAECESFGDRLRDPAIQRNTSAFSTFNIVAPPFTKLNASRTPQGCSRFLIADWRLKPLCLSVFGDFIDLIIRGSS
jgi:hypothetical protein